MIADKQFKSLKHSFKGFDLFLNGQSLEKGYKPDYVLKKQNEFIILESENSSSRKTFVGGLIKAAHFLIDQKKGMLIFIIVPKKNTTADAIAKHLKPYLKWIRPNTNLRNVFVIEDCKYLQNGKLLALDCDDFNKCALKV